MISKCSMYSTALLAVTVLDRFQTRKTRVPLVCIVPFSVLRVGGGSSVVNRVVYVYMYMFMYMLHIMSISI